MLSSAVTHRILFALVLGVTVLAYLPGLPGFFVYDDFPNLVNHPAFQEPISGWTDVQRVLGEGLSSQLGRPLSLITFALNHAVSSGFDPLAMKLTNLAIHLANGLLVYLLAWAWAARWSRPTLEPRDVSRVALLCMALWLVHPLNLTSVLYTVQRMNSLSALFVLAGLLAYTRARSLHAEGRTGWPWLAGALLLAWPAAVLAKENGILMVLFALVTEVVLYRGVGDPRARRETWIFFIIGVLPFLAALVYVAMTPGAITGGYAAREFTLIERLLTETRVLWFYVGLTVLPTVGRMSLYHDDLVLSTGLLSPPTTFLALIALAAVVLAAVRFRSRWPWLTFAVAWFLVGHLIESTVIPLRIAQEHRNYLPLVGLLFPVALYGVHALRGLRWPWLPIGLVVALLAITTATRAQNWGDYGRFVEANLVHHPESRGAHQDAIKWILDTADRNRRIAPDLLQRARHYASELDRLGQGKSLTPALYLLLIEARLHRIQRLENAQSDMEGLVTRLETIRLEPLDANLLAHAVDCTVDRRCRLPTRILETLLTAALRNPDNPARPRGYLHGARANLHIALRRDMDAAIEDLGHAVRLDPQISSYTQVWIEFMIIAGRLDEAREALAKHGDNLDEGARNVIRHQLTQQAAKRR